MAGWVLQAILWESEALSSEGGQPSASSLDVGIESITAPYPPSPLSWSTAQTLPLL